ncbi:MULTISPECIES: lipopolysaccharide biosynthesis protein [Sphingomonas]|uniref:lipopolysaccharide biosynthesis protein n=1 Tax=Sphingomonas TaxID=13687 RepID=UPI00082DB4E6|nr:lipopolysaccharide biosynthesis protein [Sphingomonas sp. CCH10-B3]
MELRPDSPPRDSESFADQVRSAVIWRSGSQILAQIIQWGATFMVIRLLAPADYGLFAMTQVILVLLNMLNGYGLASGLIQAKEIDERQIRQLFGMLILVNVALAAIQFALAPLAAAYYRQPLVETMLRVQALSYLSTPLIALSYALLSRQMEYRRQAHVNIVASIASASTALGGALMGLGVWTLVVAPMVLFTVRAVGMTVAARAYYWPSFDFRGAGTLARYGGVMAIGQLFWFFESQADVFIAGRQFDPHWLGIYTESLFLAQVFVSKIVPPLNEVAFSAYARLQHDEGAVGRGFLRSVRIVMVAALPFYIGLAATAEPLVLTMLGPKWAEGVPVVRLLALAMPFMTLQVLLSPACDALGRPGISVRNGATGAVLLTSAYLIGVHWGVMGLACAWLAAYPLYLAISLSRSLPVIGVAPAALASALLPPLLAATCMGIVVTLVARALPPLPAPLMLALLVGTGAIAYFGWLMLFARDLVGELSDTIRRRPATA